VELKYKIVVADDQYVTRTIIAEVVRALGGEVLAFADGASALAEILKGDTDLILSDYKMPAATGLELIEAVRKDPRSADVPAIMITAIDELGLRQQALGAGFNDFLNKPIDYSECRARCYNLLELRKHQRMLAAKVAGLTDAQRAVAEHGWQVEAEAARRFGLMGEWRRQGVEGHIQRVRDCAERIALHLGVGEPQAALIGAAAQLHDVGMVQVPDRIVHDAGPLSAQDRGVVQTHSQIGYDLLAGSASAVFQLGAEIALGHHEHYDGKGYPAGIAGEAIPLAARIMAVVDAFDSLCHSRPYAAVWTRAAALAYICEERSRRFDPACVDALFAITESRVPKTAHV
jgi:two-component system, response regulator RpfG